MIEFTPACRQMATLVRAVTDDALRMPTPCANYDVAELIEHIDMVSQGFAALARRDPVNTPAADEHVTTDPGWRVTVCDHLLDLADAWRDPAAWQGDTNAGDVHLANETWALVALTEVIVHGWDLARATGEALDLPEALLHTCLSHVASFVPNAPVASLWGPAVPVPDDAPVIDHIVAITGRRP